MLKWVVVGVVGILVLGGGIAAFASGGGDGGENPVLITAKVVRRDLKDEVTVTGTLGRVEERTISVSGAGAGGSGAGGGGAAGAGAAAAAGGGGGATVNQIYVEDGGELQADSPILALDGRASITENGDLAFFRKLDVGATGPDVVQLEIILRDSGFSPGKVDSLFTEQTRVALAQWQAAHLYPGDNPATEQTVTVSLQPGNGYTVGERSSAAATIGPYVPKYKNTAAGAKTSVSSAFLTDPPHIPAVAASVHALACLGTPIITIAASPTTVQEGGSSTVTVTATPAPSGCNLQVILAAGGDATPGVDYDSYSPTVTIPDGSSTASFTLKTRSDVAAESTEHAVVSVSPGAGYAVGNPGAATVAITDGTGKPVVSLIPGAGRVQEGTPVPFTLGLKQPLNVPLQVFLDYGGTAVPEEDYSPLPGAIIIPAGSTQLPISIPTLNDEQVEDEKVLVVNLDQSKGYKVGNEDGGEVIIDSEDVPEINIVGGGATSRGGGAGFQIIADQPALEDITVQYTATGTATPGVDIHPLTGTVFLPAGQTVADVPLLTLNTDVVFIPTDMIVAHWPTRVSKVLVDEGDLAPAGTKLFSITEAGFTVTLKANAADRSKLKVGQQVTVQVQGGDRTATGVITELDENATIDPDTKQQTYEGKVQVQGDVGGADGAPVNIDVTLEDRPGVLTVPIAAVKQNGKGQDVVRVIDLAHGGKIVERVVKTGLAEGSFIEIRSGLKGNEVVVVEVDRG
ncbi:MAG TPA: Calx-beta domain-containing protein [Acidimicrobiia bacterium]